MEPSKFDELTKALATATSRRQALKAIAATIGGTLGLSGIGTVFAKPCTPNGKRCNSRTNCCSGFCDPTTSKCATPTTTTTTSTTTSTTTTTTSTTTTPGPQNICTQGGDGCQPAVQCINPSNSGCCVCATDINGSFVCWDSCSSDVFCSACTSDTDCGPNMACVTSSCCANTNGLICVPLCSSLTTLNCHAGSPCESVCPDTTNPNCNCGTTMAGVPVCYNNQNGCLGTLCTSDADCGPGNACVNKNDGCGGCDNVTGGMGVCSPICTS